MRQTHGILPRSCAWKLTRRLAPVAKPWQGTTSISLSHMTHAKQVAATSQRHLCQQCSHGVKPCLCA